MRLYEFASAEEQLALLRLIIDNTWSAISQQAAQENKEKEAKRAKEALKPKRSGIRSPSKPKPIPLVPTPVKTTKPRALVKQPPANPKPIATQPPANPKPIATQPSANPKPIATQPSANTKPDATQPPANLLTKSTPVATNGQTANASFGSKDAGVVRNNSNLKNAGYGDDRHSKNGIRIIKK